MDEGERQKKQATGPSPARTASYIHIMRVFDELIQNRDRNAGNLLWTSDWKVWLIDHTRAFRWSKELLKPEALERIERTLLERMPGLTSSGLAEAMGESLSQLEIDALLARRDVIGKLFDDQDRDARRCSCAVHAGPLSDRSAVTAVLLVLRWDLGFGIWDFGRRPARARIRSHR
jgi:hypothetical protein